MRPDWSLIHEAYAWLFNQVGLSLANGLAMLDLLQATKYIRNKNNSRRKPLATITRWRNHTSLGIYFTWFHHHWADLWRRGFCLFVPSLSSCFEKATVALHFGRIRTRLKNYKFSPYTSELLERIIFLLFSNRISSITYGLHSVTGKV